MAAATSSGAHRFDPVRVGQHECDAWVAYYRHEWPAFLRAAVEMVHAGFGMNRRSTVRGAWYVLRANQAWAPYPDNDADAARDLMRRFYELVLRQDPTRSTRRRRPCSKSTGGAFTVRISTTLGQRRGAGRHAQRPLRLRLLPPPS